MSILNKIKSKLGLETEKDQRFPHLKETDPGLSYIERLIDETRSTVGGLLSSIYQAGLEFFGIGSEEKEIPKFEYPLPQDQETEKESPVEDKIAESGEAIEKVLNESYVNAEASKLNHIKKNGVSF